MSLFKRSFLKSTRLQQHKRRMFILKAGTIVFLVAALYAGLVALSQAEKLQITNVAVRGNAGVPTADVEKIANDYLAGSYYWSFPHRNKLIYPKDAIIKSITAAFPLIASAEFRVGASTLEVTITERKPAYLWCKGEPNDHFDKGCYFMDATGFVYSDAPTFSGNAYFAYYGLIKDENPIGKAYMSQTDFALLNSLRASLTEGGTEMFASLTRDDGARELYMSKSGKIIFKASQDFGALVSAFNLIKDGTDVLTRDGTSTLEYIDFRFGNKIYYKFVGDNSVLEKR